MGWRFLSARPHRARGHDELGQARAEFCQPRPTRSASHVRRLLAQTAPSLASFRLSFVAESPSRC
jgi:hypothetical protein